MKSEWNTSSQPLTTKTDKSLNSTKFVLSKSSVHNKIKLKTLVQKKTSMETVIIFIPNSPARRKTKKFKYSTKKEHSQNSGKNNNKNLP